MDAQSLRRTSEDLYRSGQFLCSEAIVYAFKPSVARCPRRLSNWRLDSR
jgi:hypothetical protein